MFRVTHPFAPRPTRFRGIVGRNGWRLKHYETHLPQEAFDAPRFAPWRLPVDAALPQPAITTHRPGVGYLIAHQGRGADYLVLAWWDGENEMPLRVWVRDGAAFAPAKAHQSVCVWDLSVIAHERDAYVRHVLKEHPDIEAYLSDMLR